MNKRQKNNPPVSGEVVILALCVVLVMITLSQILVVHHKFNGRFQRTARPRHNRNRYDLRQIEKSIAALMRQNVPSIEKHGEMLRGDVYASRTAQMITKATSEIFNYRSEGDYSVTEMEIYEYDVDVDTENRELNVSKIYNNSDNGKQKYITEYVSNIHRNQVNTNIKHTDINNTKIPYRNKKRKRLPSKIIKYCSMEPSNLEGRTVLNFTDEHLDLNDVIKDNLDILQGGVWNPANCVSRHRVAIIIPYRDRLAHLTVLLASLLPVLKRQELDFRIFVVEQYGNKTFNKGIIMNAAFKEALKQYDFQCVVFHDVDLIPEDDRNLYSCPTQPRHMSVAIDEMNYKLKYDLLVGGVLIMRVNQYEKVNGYSNMYWGWGAEDDDMAYRILHAGLKITRPPTNVARYSMIKHTKRKPTAWVTRSKLLTTAVKRYKMDGLNSVKYNLRFIHNEPLYTHIMVDIGQMV